MLGIVINLVIVGGVFRKNTHGPRRRAVRNDWASAAQVSCRVWNGWELAQAGVSPALCDGQHFLTLLSLPALGLNPHPSPACLNQGLQVPVTSVSQAPAA